MHSVQLKCLLYKHKKKKIEADYKPMFRKKPVRRV